MSKEIKNILLEDRLCYLFMCIEKYLKFRFPKRDLTILTDKMLEWTNSYWDDGCDIYAQIVPEYLFEFDNYEETNEKEFDGQLSRNDYNELISLYAEIKDENIKYELNQMLMLPIDFNNVCEGTNAYAANEPTLEIILKAQIILKKHNIEIPSTEQISCFNADNKKYKDRQSH